MTSCKSTGRCPDDPDGKSSTRSRSRALGTPSLGHLVLDTRVFLRARLADATPALVVPDLDEIVDSNYPGHRSDAGVLPLVGREDDAPLGVELALAGGAEHHAGQPPLLCRSGRAEPQTLFLPPFLGWIHLQAALGALGDHAAGRQLLPKAGGDGDASLGIHGMPVGSKKHQLRPPCSSLSPLFPTLCHQQPKRTTATAGCQQIGTKSC